MSDRIELLDANFAAPTLEGGLVWHDILSLGLEGRGWTDIQTPFDRYPARAQGVVRDPVWNLSQRSAGMLVRFETDAQAISARWNLRFESLAMGHMPATGVSGLDLYGRLDGRWRFAGNGRPEKLPDNEAVLVSGMEPGVRQFMLYLPLYNGVTGVKIGVPEGASLTPAPPWPCDDQRPIAFYGTSILQGGCASRPGMAYPAIIARRLDRPHLNLGFSGNARCEPEVADLLAELDPCAFVLDPVPNMTNLDITTLVTDMVNKIRARRPDTPIVLVENIRYQRMAFMPEQRKAHTAKNAAFRAAYDGLVAGGCAGLHYVPCDDLFGHDDEATVDGTHATDLGFVRMADVITPVLKALLG